MRFRTSINNDMETFYTDLNGFQLIRRKTYNKIPLQGNFYPMPTTAMLQDNNNRLTLYSGQPLGAAALKKGVASTWGLSGGVRMCVPPYITMACVRRSMQFTLCMYVRISWLYISLSGYFLLGGGGNGLV